jgi:hypothetical protein
VITQDGRPALVPRRSRFDSALVKALGRAFRWRRRLDTGAYPKIEEVATAEGINPSYVSHVRRMTPLAWAMRAWPGEWEGQRGQFGHAQSDRPRVG